MIPFSKSANTARAKSLGVTHINPTPGAEPDTPTHTRNGIDDDFYYEAQIAVIDPKLIRADERAKAGLLELHGVSVAPVAKHNRDRRELAAIAPQSRRGFQGFAGPAAREAIAVTKNIM